MKDEAGPLWLLLESVLESLPVRPWVIALAADATGAITYRLRLALDPRPSTLHPSTPFALRRIRARSST